jgi:hypothetical protein
VAGNDDLIGLLLEFARAALLRNPRKTECGAIGSWIGSGVCAAPFALLRNSPAQRSLARPDGPKFLAVPGAEPALCRASKELAQNGARARASS